MNYDNTELENGTNIEGGQGPDAALDRKIAAGNLKSDPKHYSKLQAAGVNDDVAECDDCGCGDPKNPHIDIVKMVGVGPSPAPATSAPKLSSSGLGKSGVNKPLTAATEKAPEPKKVGANKIATSKTPALTAPSSLSGDAATDPIDHFGSAIVGLAEGGSQIKKK